MTVHHVEVTTVLWQDCLGEVVAYLPCLM